MNEVFGEFPFSSSWSAVFASSSEKEGTKKSIAKLGSFYGLLLPSPYLPSPFLLQLFPGEIGRRRRAVEQKSSSFSPPP